MTLKVKLIIYVTFSFFQITAQNKSSSISATSINIIGELLYYNLPAQSYAIGSHFEFGHHFAVGLSMDNLRLKKPQSLNLGVRSGICYSNLSYTQRFDSPNVPAQNINSNLVCGYIGPLGKTSIPRKSIIYGSFGYFPQFMLNTSQLTILHGVKLIVGTEINNSKFKIIPFSYILGFCLSFTEVEAWFDDLKLGSPISFGLNIGINFH